MLKDRLYLFTFLSIALIVFITSAIAVSFLVAESERSFINLQIENGKREVSELVNLIESNKEIQNDKNSIIHVVQETILGTQSQMSFVSLMDWSGKIVAHPDKTLVGTLNSSSLNAVNPLEKSITAEDILANAADTANIKSIVIFLDALQNSDALLAYNINLDRLDDVLSSLTRRFYLIFLITGIALILTCFIVVRILGSGYEKRLELANKHLESELVNTSKLNSDLVAYQQRKLKESQELKSDNTVDDTPDPAKKRILTYIRNELLTIPIETIAYIYVDHSITYVVCFDGKKSTTGSSLDELYSNLDAQNFYRANRQAIIAVQAIDKIIKYGNNQLKIIVQPEAEIDIIISKNKAAEFKQWLNL